MYLSGLRGTDDYGNIFPDAGNASVVSSPLPTASGGANDYAPYFSLAAQVVNTWGAVQKTQTDADVAKALAARGIVPQGYTAYRSSPVAASQPGASYSPFPANGAATGTINPLLIVLAGAAIAAWIAFK